MTHHVVTLCVMLHIRACDPWYLPRDAHVRVLSVQKWLDAIPNNMSCHKWFPGKNVTCFVKPPAVAWEVAAQNRCILI